MLFDGRKKEAHAANSPHFDHDTTSFKKRLGWWIKNPPSETMILDVTPAMAAEMLAYNDRNRPLRSRTVEKYAEDMKAGRWLYTRVPVIFSGHRLIDGQHRLEAIVASGQTVKIDIAFGAPDSAFNFIDIGQKRTPGDIFSINGVPNAVLMAAATNLVMHYDAGLTLTALSAGSRTPSDQLYAAYCKLPRFEESARFGHLFQSNPGLLSPSLAVALHYICARHHRTQADAFFTKLATGEDLKRGDPVFSLRKRLLDNLAKTEKLPKRELAVYTIKTWNAVRGGYGVKTLKFQDSEAFPRAR